MTRAFFIQGTNIQIREYLLCSIPGIQMTRVFSIPGIQMKRVFSIPGSQMTRVFSLLLCTVHNGAKILHPFYNLQYLYAVAFLFPQNMHLSNLVILGMSTWRKEYFICNNFDIFLQEVPFSPHPTSSSLKGVHALNRASERKSLRIPCLRRRSTTRSEKKSYEPRNDNVINSKLLKPSSPSHTLLLHSFHNYYCKGRKGHKKFLKEVINSELWTDANWHAWLSKKRPSCRRPFFKIISFLLHIKRV